MQSRGLRPTTLEDGSVGVIVEPEQRLDSHLEDITGSWVAPGPGETAPCLPYVVCHSACRPGPGVLEIVWNNDYSYLVGKPVTVQFDVAASTGEAV